MAELLLEIGVEEIPAAYLDPALAQLEAKGRALLTDLRLTFDAVKALGTPRRLALRVSGLAAEQPEKREWVRGPAERAAMDAEGRPTKAAEGFARSQGVAVEALQLRETANGRYLMVERVEPGRPAAEVLPEALAGLITQLDFPRSMRWGSGDLRFARPIRWLVALLNEAVLPFTVQEIETGRETFGHRVLSTGPVHLATASDYEAALRRAHVIADPAARRAEVWRQAQRTAAEAGGRVAEDEETQALLDEVTNLVEWPTAFLGRFALDALELPRDVLVTSMRVHQRYFPVEDQSGQLLAAFVGIRNGGTLALENVVRGNEKVLRARLADARFFFAEDRKRSLAERVPELEHVVFHAGLGSLRDKTERLRRLARILVEWLELGEQLASVLDRAAYLCKADLLTHMVKEFPELEGIMGGHYSRLQGEAESVARAVEEHYLPRGARSGVPQTMAGTLLALADKLDNLAAGFASGREPTGSQDPYGLRRQALGILRLLRQAGLAVSVEKLVEYALAGLPLEGAQDDAQRAVWREACLVFLRGRLQGMLEEEGVPYDVAAAVLARGFDRIPDVYNRVAAIGRLLASAHRDDVLTVHRRAANLGAKAAGTEVQPHLLQEDAERVAYHALCSAEERARTALAAFDYDRFYEALAELRRPVDAFLDEVLVMAPDPAVRANRLNLLRRVAESVNLPADLSLLVVAK